MSSFLFGVLGGILAWIATTVIGHPLLAFLNLRGETARLLNLSAYEHQQVLQSRISWHSNAYQNELLQCGLELRTFVAAHHYFTKSIRLFRFDPYGASTLLLEQLATANAGSSVGDDLRSRIALKLRIRLPPST